MNTYGVSFTIDYDNGWQARYDSFMEAIRKSSRVWSETTSFCLVETSETLEQFERRLYLSLFSPSKDKMLVMDIRYINGKARGNIQNPATLKALLPHITLH